MSNSRPVVNRAKDRRIEIERIPGAKSRQRHRHACRPYILSIVYGDRVIRAVEPARRNRGAKTVVWLTWIRLSVRRTFSHSARDLPLLFSQPTHRPVRSFVRLKLIYTPSWPPRLGLLACILQPSSVIKEFSDCGGKLEQIPPPRCPSFESEVD